MPRLARWLAAAAVFCASAAAHAGIPTLCERSLDITAADQDRVLRFSAVVKDELARSGAGVAIVSRAGLDLSRFGLLYSHAGIALRGDDGAWSVRQLYYACDEHRPRLFDQGISGFALGADAPARGHVALVFLPPDQAAPLQAAAADRRLALSLLAGRYSANAYAFGTRYQNCNQWVAEMIASAFGRLDADHGADDGADARARAQAWLRAQGYAAGPVRVPSHWLMFAGQFVPLLHVGDHPLDDVYALALRVSVPDAIEAFVHQRLPAATRVELCHDRDRVVVHRGWTALGEACTPAPGDDVIALSD